MKRVLLAVALSWCVVAALVGHGHARCRDAGAEAAPLLLSRRGAIHAIFTLRFAQLQPSTP